ncbi:hypothetical protein ACWCPM_05695 [Streptomyces sp. NPDC002309]
MERGGLLIVSAAKRNKFGKATAEEMASAGLELIDEGAGVHPSHMFRTMKYTDGRVITPHERAFAWRMYRRL